MTEGPNSPACDDLVEVGRLAALGRLTPGAVHELANPLAALLGIAELLLAEHEPDAKAAERVQVIVDTAREISATVRVLQAYSRERLAPRGAVALGRLVGETVELVRRTSGMRDVALEEIRPGVEISVDAHASELRQAVLTLVLNAIEAQATGGKVTVATGVEDGSAAVTVAGGRGSGLGLEACRTIALRHGGALDEAGSGTAFVLRLPLSGAA